MRVVSIVCNKLRKNLIPTRLAIITITNDAHPVSNEATTSPGRMNHYNISHTQVSTRHLHDAASPRPTAPHPYLALAYCFSTVSVWMFLSISALVLDCCRTLFGPSWVQLVHSCSVQSSVVRSGPSACPICSALDFIYKKFQSFFRLYAVIRMLSVQL